MDLRIFAGFVFLHFFGLLGNFATWGIPLPRMSDLPCSSTRINSETLPSSPDSWTISIKDLLATPERFDHQFVIVRGIVTRLELHVDESRLFIDYVFWLKDGKHRVLVFGQHDRTKGDIQTVTDRMVEVRGFFWKERFVNGYRLENNLEAQQVEFFPRMDADQA